MAWRRWHLVLSVWLVVGHRIQSGFRKPGEAAALLEAAKERARRDQHADRAEVLRKFQECPQDLWLSAEELIDRFVNGIHRPAPLTINFDADRWVKVAEENPGAAQSFTTNVQNLWQVAMLPHPPLEASRTKRDQQVYSYANERYDTEKWFFGFTRAPEELSSAMERPVSAAPGVFGGAKNGNALQSVYGYSALFLAPHVWNRSTIIGKDLKVAFSDLGQPKDYDANFPKWTPWKHRPEPKVTDPVLQIPHLEAAGGLRYLGTFDNPVAALKTVSCYEFARWAELLEGKESTTGLDYLEVSIFGGVTFAQDVEKVVINVPTLNSTSSIAALDIGEQSHVLRKIRKTLEVQQKVTNISMGNSSQCRMWRLARLRKIRRISWCLSVDNRRCIREADATSDLSCVQ